MQRKQNERSSSSEAPEMIFFLIHFVIVLVWLPLCGISNGKCYIYLNRSVFTPFLELLKCCGDPLLHLLCLAFSRHVIVSKFDIIKMNKKTFSAQIIIIMKTSTLELTHFQMSHNISLNGQWTADFKMRTVYQSSNFCLKIIINVSFAFSLLFCFRFSSAICFKCTSTMYDVRWPVMHPMHILVEKRTHKFKTKRNERKNKNE